MADYQGSVTGEMIDKAVTKVCGMISGKVSFSPQMSTGGGTNVGNVLCGYADPIVMLSTDSNLNLCWEKFGNNLIISVYGDNMPSTCTVYYFIIERGN